MSSSPYGPDNTLTVYHQKQLNIADIVSTP